LRDLLLEKYEKKVKLKKSIKKVGKRGKNVKERKEKGIHIDRVACGCCNNSDSCSDVITSPIKGKGKGKTGSLYEQLETTWTCYISLQ